LCIIDLICIVCVFIKTNKCTGPYTNILKYKDKKKLLELSYATEQGEKKSHPLDFDFDSDSSFSAQNLRPLRSRSSR
jgi:hypothetical protein